MNSEKIKLSVVWLKRDLRLADHEALYHALSSKKPCLILYVFEEILLNDFHYSSRHFNFIKQSLIDINNQLAILNTQVLCVKGSVIEVLEVLLKKYSIVLYSHQETGIGLTFDRDKELKLWADSGGIQWYEFLQQGVFRRLPNRKKWIHLWTSHMNRPIFNFSPINDQLLSKASIASLEKDLVVMDLQTSKSKWFQPGNITKYQFLVTLIL